MFPWIWIKVIGSQWYWSYEYSSMEAMIENFAFDSFIVPMDELKDKALRLLAVDNNVVLPLGLPIKFLITSNDVLHS
jgi:heme/copper-type cytochrome/quinol oxidase subunit 2